MPRKNRDYEVLLEEERLIVDATETIHRLMEEQAVSRTELARRIGATKGHVSQLLDGKRNMTLGTLSRLLHAVGHRAQIQTQPLDRRVTASQPMLMHQLPAYLNSTRATAPLVADFVGRLESVSSRPAFAVTRLNEFANDKGCDRDVSDLIAGAA